MKNIEEAVRELSREELEVVAREGIQSKLSSLKDVLRKINYNARAEKKSELKETILWYEKLKEKITRWGLWNPEYDKYYDSAIKGGLESIPEIIY